MRIQTFDYSVDILQALLWQYDDSPNVRALVQDDQNWYDENQDLFWSSWYDDVFNLVTANTFGLSVWSVILDLPLLVVLIPEPVGEQIFGFNDFSGAPINDYFNFTNGTYAPSSTGITLTVEEQRFILRLRYFQLTTRADITSINAFFNYLMATSAIDPIGSIYAIDNLDMTMDYVINFDMDGSLRKALVDYDLLPRPAGVKINYLVTTNEVFGFNDYSGPEEENTYFNFGNGTYVKESFI